MSYKVLITTSGTGSRLGELTKHTNKALVRIGKKPAISYIVELYPTDTEFVVTLGHNGEQVKDFLELAYPEHSFTFVNIDKYDGPGTSLGYSMLQAKDVLQEPFIFHACDTIVEKFDIPSLKSNWAAGISLEHFDQYTSFRMANDGRILEFNKKKEGKVGDLGHVGLIGVYDYKHYWETLEKLYKENPTDSSLNDTATLTEMLKGGTDIHGVSIREWFDIGNLEALAEARNKISDHFDNLDKVDESLFIFKDFVIKFFSDPEKVKNRVERGKVLGSLAPETIAVRTNFYKYPYVEGDTYSEAVTPDDLEKFINWAQSNLWRPVSEVSSEEFKTICRNFYEHKTKERIEKFLKQNNIQDGETIVNDVKVPPLKDVFEKIDFDWLSNGVQTGFHGDFVLENILKTKNGYCLLDWRQDFGGLLRGGDMYYDLAKFYHNLVVNHDTVSCDGFTVDVKDEIVSCNIDRKEHLLESERRFEEIAKAKGFDLKKIEVLRVIIWLNMSPLHHYPFNIFLFYFGKYHLWQALKNK
jgi:NDP-sugar pyrophosphorylase family protein